MILTLDRFLYDSGSGVVQIDSNFVKIPMVTLALMVSIDSKYCVEYYVTSGARCCKLIVTLHRFL